MTSEVERAMATLRFKGYDVWRMDFPPPPFSGLYRISGGPEITEAQMINAADTLDATTLSTDGVVIVGIPPS